MTQYYITIGFYDPLFVKFLLYMYSGQVYKPSKSQKKWPTDDKIIINSHKETINTDTSVMVNGAMLLYPATLFRVSAMVSQVVKHVVTSRPHGAGMAGGCGLGRLGEGGGGGV